VCTGGGRCHAGAGRSGWGGRGPPPAGGRRVRAAGPRPPPVGASGRLSSVKKVKLPCVPRRSGTLIPERQVPWKRSGGKVTGTRSTEENTPWSPRIFQNGGALRNSRRRGRPGGT